MRTKNKVLGSAALISLLCVLQNTEAQAALITVNGTHVDFSYDSSLIGVFGTPTVAGDNLFFSPTSLTASSLNNAGMAMLSATTYIDISTHTGYGFSGMTLTEQGDYQLLGRSGFVADNGELLVIDKNNPPAGGSGANAFLATSDDMTLHNGAMHAWTADAQIDLTGSAWSDTDSVRVTLENLLEAYTASSECTSEDHRHRHGKHRKSRHHKSDACGAQLSFIQNKYTGLNVQVSDRSIVSTSAVPIAPSGILFFSGLLSMLGFNRRGRIPCNESR